MSDDNLETKKRTKQLPVAIIATDNETALVEYYSSDGLVRVSIPRNKLFDSGKVDEDVLESGIPYGDDFDAVLPKDIIRAFHANGLWTYADVMRERQLVTDLLIVKLVAPVLEKITAKISEVNNG